MPNCDFFAAGPDHRAVLEFVLSQKNCRVYELGSEPDQDFCANSERWQILKIVTPSQTGTIGILGHPCCFNYIRMMQTVNLLGVGSP
jgi:hypothetical protein